VLVGHKWVVVLVVLVVLGGTAMVVVEAGVVTVVVGAARAATGVGGALGEVPLDSATWVWAEQSMKSMATAVAVTRGAATTFVTGWRMTPRFSCRMP